MTLALPAAAASLLAGIGRTPLVELDVLADVVPGARAFGKLESCNPGGSIKDRPVARMMLGALRRGALSGGKRLLDSSSGNAGIAYAMLGAALEVPITLVVPGNASAERLARIRAHGAELVLTDPLEGYDFAIAQARRLASEHPGRYVHSDQYGNDDNWRAHHATTGVEILEQVAAATAGGVPDVFVCGVGTGGSLTGIGRRLREVNPDVVIVAIVPELFPGIEGLKPLGHEGDFVPPILDASLIDVRVEVRTEDALAATLALARRGLFVGPSSGGSVHALRQVAAEALARRRRGVRAPIAVTLLNDTGERYASTGMWDAT